MAAAQQHARVVEEHERYTVVEKIGRAGEIVRELDPQRARAQDQRVRRCGGRRARVPEIEDVIERHDNYWVVEKLGEAAKVAASVDPRQT